MPAYAFVLSVLATLWLLPPLFVAALRVAP